MEGRGRLSDVDRLDDLLAQPLHVRTAAVDADRLGRGDHLVVGGLVDRPRDVQLELELAPPGGRDREGPRGPLDPRAHVLHVHRVDLIGELALDFHLSAPEFTDRTATPSREFRHPPGPQRQEYRSDEEAYTT